MKVTILCALLLATITLVNGDGGAISVINNKISNSTILTTINTYRTVRDGESEYEEVADGAPIPTNPGETKTIAISEGYSKYEFIVYSNPKVIFMSEYTSKPINLCFKTWGTDSDPQIGQTDCKAPSAHARPLSDGAAISVTNDATFRSGINLSYDLKNDQGTEEQHKGSPGLINPGETKTFAISKGAEEIDFAIANPKTNSEFLFKARFSRPVKLCFKTWGTINNPQFSQIDC